MFNFGLVPQDTDQLEVRSGQEDMLTNIIVNHGGELIVDLELTIEGAIIRPLDNVLAAIDVNIHYAVDDMCQKGLESFY